MFYRKELFGGKISDSTLTPTWLNHVAVPCDVWPGKFYMEKNPEIYLEMCILQLVRTQVNVFVLNQTQCTKLKSIFVVI